MNRISALTSIRFFMMMLIVFSHFEFLQRYNESNIIYNLFFKNSYFAVDFFFIMSGYGMMLSYTRKKNTFPNISLKNCGIFAISHVKKIYKLYLATMIIYLPLQCFFDIKVNGLSLVPLVLLEIKKIILCIPLLQSATGIHAYSHAFNSVSWFLSSLFCIYLVSPIALKFLAKIKKTSTYTIILFLNFFILFEAHIYLKKIEITTFFDDLVYSSPYCRFLYVTIGMILAKLFLSSNTKLSNIIGTKTECFICFISLIFIVSKNSIATFFPSMAFYNVFISIIIICLLCFIFSFQNGFISKLLQSEKLVTLGNISMYIFLIHYPIREYIDALIRFSGFKDYQFFGLVNAVITIVITFLISFKIYKVKAHYDSNKK